MFKLLLDKLDNDTLIIFGLVGIAVMYVLKNPPDGQQIVSNIVSIFGGYIGGQYIATKNNQ